MKKEKKKVSLLDASSKRLLIQLKKRQREEDEGLVEENDAKRAKRDDEVPRSPRPAVFVDIPRYQGRLHLREPLLLRVSMLMVAKCVVVVPCALIAPALALDVTATTREVGETAIVTATMVVIVVVILFVTVIVTTVVTAAINEIETEIIVIEITIATAATVVRATTTIAVIAANVPNMTETCHQKRLADVMRERQGLTMIATNRHGDDLPPLDDARAPLVVRPHHVALRIVKTVHHREIENRVASHQSIYCN